MSCYRNLQLQVGEILIQQDNVAGKGLINWLLGLLRIICYESVLYVYTFIPDIQ